MSSAAAAVQVDHDDANSGAPVYSLDGGSNTEEENKEIEEGGEGDDYDAYEDNEEYDLYDGYEEYEAYEGREFEDEYEYFDFEPVETDPESVEGYGLDITVTPPQNDDSSMIGDWVYGRRNNFVLPSLDTFRGQDVVHDRTRLRPPWREHGTGRLADGRVSKLWTEPNVYHPQWAIAMERNEAIADDRKRKEVKDEMEALSLEW